MIDFELTEEHLALQKTVREFVAGEVAPHIKEWDEAHHFEKSVFTKMGDSDCSAFVFPNNTAEQGLIIFRSVWCVKNSKRAILFCAWR